jgi:CRISPR-associated protein Cas1
VIKRTIEISNKSHLSLRNKQLVISQDGNEVGQIPVEDIGELILNDARITVTQALMVESQKNNVALVLCDEKHLPISTLLPISEGNKLHSKILRAQIEVKASTKKRLWQNTIQAKIRNQAQTLRYFNAGFKHLEAMVPRVKSGDPTNLEATAARYYWRELFGNDFRRDRKLEGTNALLNYGYSITRAAIARALVGTGLHPAIGINHHSQYNGLALADDIIEPFRPWVDQIVKEITIDACAPKDITKETKQRLLGLLERSVSYKGEKAPFMVSLGYLAADLKHAIQENKKTLNWPCKDH